MDNYCAALYTKLNKFTANLDSKQGLPAEEDHCSRTKPKKKKKKKEEIWPVWERKKMPRVRFVKPHRGKREVGVAREVCVCVCVGGGGGVRRASQRRIQGVSVVNILTATPNPLSERGR